MMRMVLDPEGLVDLTIAIRSGMPVSRRERPVIIEPRMTHVRDGVCSSSIKLGSHCGTHIDAPYHFHANGATADMLPLSSLILTACVLDLRACALALDAAAILRAAAVWGGLAPRTAVLLWTGWDRFFGTDEMHVHPYLTPDGAQALVNAGVSVVGIDAIGVDDSLGTEFPAHRLLLGAGVPIVENLRGLEALGPGPCGFACVPLLIEAIDAAPVRAFAWRLETGAP